MSLEADIDLGLRTKIIEKDKKSFVDFGLNLPSNALPFRRFVL